MIKSFITNIKVLTAYSDGDKDPKTKEAIEYLRAKLMARQAELDAKVKSSLKPVKYQITVNPIN